MNDTRETRLGTIEIRTSIKDGKKRISGYAAVFDQLSGNLGGFREKIAPGAFDAVINDDVRALFNHEPHLILGRTTAGTLSLNIDAIGLHYRIDPPDTQYACDLIECIRRGDITQSSFAFRVEEDHWDKDDDSRLIRTIKQFKRLYDIAPVTYPAYPDTTVALRSLMNCHRQSNRGNVLSEECYTFTTGRRKQAALLSRQEKYHVRG